MTFEHFVRRVAQYVAVGLAVRRQNLPTTAPAHERVTAFLLQLWVRRADVAAGGVAGLTWHSEEQLLRIETAKLKSFVEIDRPDRLFYGGGAFFNSIRRVAKNTDDVWKRWSNGHPPDLSTVDEMVTLCRKAHLELEKDLRFVGTLVQAGPVGGVTLIGFKDLSQEEARQFGESGAHAEFDDRAGEAAQSPDFTPDQSLRSALRISASLRVVEHPALIHAHLFVEDLRITGLPGCGRTSALYHMLATTKMHTFVLTENSAYRLASEPSPLMVGIDDVHQLDQQVVRSALDLLDRRRSAGEMVKLIVTYPRPEELRTRQRHPGLFVGPFRTLDIDQRTTTFVRDVAMSVAAEFKTKAEDFERLIASVHPEVAPVDIKRLFNPVSDLSTTGHEYWANEFCSLPERDQTTLRLISAVRAFHQEEVNYTMLRLLWVEYCQRNAADLDASLIDLEQRGWFDVRTTEEGERCVHTDRTRIPPEAFHIRGVFVQNIGTWLFDHERCQDPDFVGTVGRALYVYSLMDGDEDRADNILASVVTKFPNNFGDALLLADYSPARAVTIFTHVFEEATAETSLLWKIAAARCWQKGLDSLAIEASQHVRPTASSRNAETIATLRATWNSESRQLLRLDVDAERLDETIKMWEILLTWGEAELVEEWLRKVKELPTGLRNRLSALEDRCHSLLRSKSS